MSPLLLRHLHLDKILLQPLEDLANPAKDEQGLVLASAKQKTRARKSGGLDSDF